MSERTWAKGLLRIAEALRQEIGEAGLEVYAEVLDSVTTPEEWEEFSREVVLSRRWRFFPSVAEMLDALDEWRGFPPLDTEAAAAYERVLECRTYSPEGGAQWDQRSVRESCGYAAAMAFVEAGGHYGFVTTWDEARRRQRFLDAYKREARGDPAKRLLAATSTSPQLPPGPAVEVSRAEARGLLRLVEAGVPTAERRKAVVVELTDERRAEIVRTLAART